MKFTIVSTFLLGAHAASYSAQGAQTASRGDGQASASGAYEPLATQPGVAPPATAQQAAGNVTALLERDVKAVDARVLAYGGGDPASIFEAARGLVTLVHDLTRVANGTKASLPAAAGDGAPPVVRASFTTSGGDSHGGSADAMRQAVELLLRDINETKWAFQLGSICDVMYFVVGKIGESFHDLFEAVLAQAPATAQAAAQQTAAGAGQAFKQSQALLGPRYCINAHAVPRNSSSTHRHPELPSFPPSGPAYRVLGGNMTAASSYSTKPATADAAAAGTGQPMQLDATPTSSAARPAATHDRAQGAAAEITGSGDARAATAGAAGGMRVPAAAAWGFLLAVPGFLL